MTCHQNDCRFFVYIYRGEIAMKSDDLKDLVEKMESERLGRKVTLSQEEFEDALDGLAKLGYIKQVSPVVPLGRIYDMIKSDGGYESYAVQERIKGGVILDVGVAFLLDDGHVLIDNEADGADRETWLETKKSYLKKYVT